MEDNLKKMIKTSKILYRDIRHLKTSIRYELEGEDLIEGSFFDFFPFVEGALAIEKERKRNTTDFNQTKILRGEPKIFPDLIDKGDEIYNDYNFLQYLLKLYDGTYKEESEKGNITFSSGRQITSTKFVKSKDEDRVEIEVKDKFKKTLYIYKIPFKNIGLYINSFKN